MDSNTAFASLKLHDAALLHVALDWRSGVVTFAVKAFLDGSAHAAIDCQLCFEGLLDLHAPHALPWGPSNFINVSRFSAPDQFELEMQSGDVITVTARRFELRRV